MSDFLTRIYPNNLNPASQYSDDTFAAADDLQNTGLLCLQHPRQLPAAVLPLLDERSQENSTSTGRCDGRIGNDVRFAPYKHPLTKILNMRRAHHDTLGN
ncbi:hypothetical protein PV328_011943 [Microctonus aethiopoides]|uniref:Uncharacterized protein n=1 Tax=Microctonus aethiopoides TaxID=144406 RepID=A0AA39FH69_9HYME|nr:hypothetical protein PV328_011943 [Microctonus aethiopoides]